MPTFEEAGIDGDIGFMHRVVMAPADTPPEVLKKLEESFLALAEDKTFKNPMKKLGESTDMMTGVDYHGVREEQAAAYEVLVVELTSQ